MIGAEKGGNMFSNVEWLFFDIGSTLVDEQLAYRHRFRDIAEAAGVSEEFVFDTALQFYRQNQKGDKETAKLLGVKMPPWHTEDEILYSDAISCLAALHQTYKIGIIANQDYGTEKRLTKYGILSYVDLVIASAEEGVVKPDRRIFEIALERSNCPPEQAVMIGDRIDNDIIPAKWLGMGAIWIRQGFGQYWTVNGEKETADCTVGSLSELLEIL